MELSWVKVSSAGEAWLDVPGCLGQGMGILVCIYHMAQTPSYKLAFQKNWSQA